MKTILQTEPTWWKEEWKQCEETKKNTDQVECHHITRMLNCKLLSVYAREKIFPINMQRNKEYNQNERAYQYQHDN